MSETTTAIDVIRARGATQPVGLAMVMGTGLSSIADNLEDAITIPYADLPGFPAGGVSGHEGRLVIGIWEGSQIAIMQGRAHYYETGQVAAMAVPLETLALLGVQTVILTNSAGSLHVDWYPGNIVIITDHINFAGVNPLIGMGGDDRFVSMADAYDKRVLARLRRAAVNAGIPSIREGVYMWFAGPSFETAAEVRMARILGADLVGMSTVPEVLLARKLGLRVGAISVVTNFATGIAGGNPSHDETKQVAMSGSIALKRLLRTFLRNIDGST